MSEEMVDIWNALRDESKRRRAENREKSPALLNAAGIPYRSNNGGEHLMINVAGRRIDFWPGTGKWIVQAKGQDGQVRNRGVMDLIAWIKREKARKAA